MKTLARILVSVFCLAVLLFCCFGFLATFEPLDRSVQITFRLVYGFVGFLAVLGIVMANTRGDG